MASTSQIKVVRTVAGRVVHSNVTRQPVIANLGTGANAGNVPKLPSSVPAIHNPFNRQRR